MITRKHFLIGGIVTELLISGFLIVYDPLGAIFMAVGAIGAGIFIQLMSTLENEKISKTAPENEWIGT